MIERREKSVCGVVVTFNRKELLISCLEALKEQTCRLDAILIVDNASTDGTPQMLVDQGYIQKAPPIGILKPYQVFSEIKNQKNEIIEVIYIRLGVNTGGAGGFYIGQKKAFELDFDWIWLMDDDGLPEIKCLSKLLESNLKHNLKASNPLVLDKGNHHILSFGLSEELKTVKSAISESINGIILNKANPFNGTLLHKELIKDVGFIKKEMFIWGDETEYFKRLLLFGYDFATVTSALFYHPTSKTVVSKKFFGLLKIKKKPDKLEMNFIRNQGYINMRYNNITSHYIVFKYFIFFLLEGKIKKSFLSLAYYIDGIFNCFKLKALR